MASRRSAQKSGSKPTSPLVIDVSRLGRRPGEMITLDTTVASPSRIGLDLVAIEPGTDMDLDLRLESVSEGVLVTGTVHAPTSGQCSRCLGPVTGEVEIELTELFAYPDSITESTTDDDEVGRVDDHTVNLEQPIIDAVGLVLPFAPACSPDCPGLCPDCGVAMATAEPGHHHDKIDPRWAKLAEIAVPDPGSPDPGSGASRR